MPNGRAVPPHQELPPLAGAGAAGEEAEHDRDGDDQPAAQRVDDLAVAVEVGLLLRRRPEQRPEPVGQHDVRGHDRTHQQPEHQEQQDLGAEHLGEDAGVPDALEPQPVGPHPGEHGDQEEGDDQHDDRADQRARPLRRAGRRERRTGSGLPSSKIPLTLARPSRQFSRVPRTNCRSPGHEVRGLQHRQRVVVRAQPQRAVRRPVARRAGDDPHLLAVRVLRGVLLRGARVVGQLLVGLGRQHQPLHHGRAAEDLRGPHDRLQHGLQGRVDRHVVLLHRRQRAGGVGLADPHRRRERGLAGQQVGGRDQGVEPRRLVPARPRPRAPRSRAPPRAARRPTSGRGVAHPQLGRSADLSRA